MKNLPLFLSRNNSRVLLFIVFIVLLLRSLFVMYSYSKSGTSNWSDDFYYLSMGEQIASGDWDPSADGRPNMVVGPVIPVVVALLEILFKDPVIPFFVFNIIITSLLVFLLFYLGKYLFDETTGWILSIWGVFFIDFYKYLPHILKEPLLYLLLPLSILTVLKAIRHSYSLRYLFLASLAYVFLVHTDERFIVYFPVYLLGFLLVRPLKLIRFLKPASVFTLFVLLFMLPWNIRNYRVFDQVVILTPRTTVFTSKLWGENLDVSASHFANEEARKNLNESRVEKAADFSEKFGIKPVEQGKWEARIKAFINYWQPAYFKPTYIQYGFRPQKWSFVHNMSGLLFYGIFLPFYLAGIILMIRRRHYLGLFVATIPVIHSLLHAYMVWPLERYRSPLNFIIAMIGIWTVLELKKKLSRRNLEHISQAQPLTYKG